MRRFTNTHACVYVHTYTPTTQRMVRLVARGLSAQGTKEELSQRLEHVVSSTGPVHVRGEKGVCVWRGGDGRRGREGGTER